MTWALILASQRYLAREAICMAARSACSDSTGGAVAQTGRAFGMTAIAWSRNLTPKKAEAVGAISVTRKRSCSQGPIRVAELLTLRLKDFPDRSLLSR
jgi:hypothetical protein